MAVDPARAALRDRAISLFGLVLLWWVCARLAAAPRLLPPPQAVLAFLWQGLVAGDIARNVGITLLRVAGAFLLSMVVGSAIGTLAGRSRRADALADPWIVIALNLPALVVILLAYVWIGLNEFAAIAAVAIVKVPTVIVTVREGARALDPGPRSWPRPTGCRPGGGCAMWWRRSLPPISPPPGAAGSPSPGRSC